MREQYLRLLGYVRPYAGRVALAIVLAFVVSGATAAVAWLVRPLLDKALIGGDPKMLRLVPLAVLTAVFVKTSASYAQVVVMQAVGQRVLRDIRNDLNRTVLRLPVSHFSQAGSADMVSRMLNDVGQLNRAASGIVRDIIQNGATALALAAVVVHQDPLLAAIALGVFPIAMYPLTVLARRLRKRSRQGQEAAAELTRHFAEGIAGIREVKAFGAQKREENRFGLANAVYQRRVVQMLRLVAIPPPMMEMVGTIGIIGIISYGGARVFAGDLTVGALMSFITACMMLYGPVRALAGSFAGIQQAMGAAVRIFELMDQPREAGADDDDTRLALDGVRKGISFENVSYTYPSGDGAGVTDLSLRAGVGETVALVGASGAGKTTMVNLIPRFLDPQAGTIRIDGHDSRVVSLASLRRQIAIVGQEALLFDDTVEANIAYGAGDREPSPEEIERAARRAHAHDFIMNLPDGYNSRVGERGGLLSGGQRQRIAIARAILKDAPILILDEATSALDSESERHVQEALAELMENRTTFVIAHRLATVRHATQILVLDGGRIVERGTHEELMAVNGTYRHLHDLQFSAAGRAG